MIHPRQGHTATLLRDGSVSIIGGLDPQGNITGTLISEAERYDPARGSFQPAGSTVLPRDYPRREPFTRIDLTPAGTRARVSDPQHLRRGRAARNVPSSGAGFPGRAGQQPHLSRPAQRCGCADAGRTKGSAVCSRCESGSPAGSPPPGATADRRSPRPARPVWAPIRNRSSNLLPPRRASGTRQNHAAGVAPPVAGQALLPGDGVEELSQGML